MSIQYKWIEYIVGWDFRLSYILPEISLIEQPFITQMGSALTIVFLLAGLINGLCCLITFKNKSVHEISCGLYLLGSSITNLIVMILFGLKFFILLLLLTQMLMITNRSFLVVQCHSIDFLLRVCLSMDQCLCSFGTYYDSSQRSQF